MPHQPPQLTPTSRLLIRAAGATETWRPLTQWSIAFVSLAAVLALDVVTGAQVTLAFLYLLLVGFATWSLGERKGLAFALFVAFCAATLRHVQYQARPDHLMTATTEAWNAFSRILSLGLVVVMVSGMRGAIQMERWRASTDGLTGVLNKAAFSRSIGSVVEQARGSGRKLILCYMDLDGFKNVNDRHGHSAGDDILRLFADSAVDAIRAEDLFARIGGDEFVALLTVPASEDADHVATLVHRRLSNILAATGLQVSCSMGALVATAAQLDPLDTAVQLADSLMYEVKRAGKNALRVGRIDPARAPKAFGGFQCPPDLVISPPVGERVGGPAHDRRQA